MDKMLTYKEWRDIVDNASYRDDDAKMEIAFKEARQGMIPESEAVRIPAVEKWPGWAKRIYVAFDGFETEATNLKGQCQTIAIIPRPTPKWVPQVSELVFMDDRA